MTMRNQEYYYWICAACGYHSATACIGGNRMWLYCNRCFAESPPDGDDSAYRLRIMPDPLLRRREH